MSRRLLMSLTVAAVMGLSAGCSSSATSSQPSGSAITPSLAPSEQSVAPSEQATATTASVARPLVVVLVAADIGTLDPGENWYGGGTYILADVYDRLFKMGGSPAAPQPLLAAEVPTTANGGISADGATYTIKLKPGAKFHDGTPVDASAVVFSFNRINSLKLGPEAVSAHWITKAEAVDPLTVRFTLSQPLGDFVAALASGWGGYIVSPTAIKAHEVAGDSAHAWLLTHDAGSGPYEIAQADTAAKQVTLQRVGDYWGGWSDGPHVESAILRWGLDSATARLLLERGDADVAIGLAPSDFSQVQKDSGIVASSYPGLYQVNIDFNNSTAPFNDLKVRQAMQYSFDQATINKTIYGGLLGSMVGVIAAGYPEAYPVTTTFPFNLATAKQLLSEAGYNASNPLQFTVSPLHFWGEDSEVLQFWQSELATIGVEMTIRETDVATFETAWSGCNANTTPNIAQAFTGGVEGDYLSGWDALWDAYYHVPCNTFYSQDAAATALLLKIPQLSDPSARKPLMTQLNQILTDDAQTIWLGTVPGLLAMRDVVQGYVYTDLNDATYLPLSVMSLTK